MSLNAIWFMLIFVLLGGYAVLDGFDLGVGVLTLLLPSENHRRLSINAIAPIWDGNEVWLLTGGGALFAAFPGVYATVFSGFYLALILVLAALIFRAVSMEFRGKVDNASWRRLWDTAFGVSSLLLAVLFGVALGNVLRGVPINSAGDYGGTFLDLLNPYAVAIGVLSLLALTMHGAVYLRGKLDTAAHGRLAALANVAWIGTAIVFVAITIWTSRLNPTLLRFNALTCGLIVIWAAAIICVPVALRQGRTAAAFVASSTMIASMMGLAGAGLFPRLLPASNGDANSLTITNSCSSQLTLQTMLIIALIGMPLVIVYTLLIHRVFRGKVVIGPDSY